MNWEYREFMDCWLCGTQMDGCGVILNTYEDGSQTWDANVVNNGSLVMMHGFNSREEAMMEAEKEFEERKTYC